MTEHEVPLEEVNEHIQHHAHESKERWIGGVALSTALMATCAALTALLAGHFESESIKEHTEEFDKWSYYQAKGIELLMLQTKSELLAASGKQATPADGAKIDEYKAKRDESAHDAKALHERSRQHGAAQERFALGVTLFQVAIAIGAISVLTRRRPFWYVSLCFGAAGVVLAVTGWRTLPPHHENAEHSATGALALHARDA